jgi:hypothetical protein
MEGRRGLGKIEVFTPLGEPVASFGEQAEFRETIAEGPAKIYEFRPGGMAVDGSGTVYVTDLHATTFESRIMVFKPEGPGDFEHYIYAGRAQDVGASHGSVNYLPEYQIALDENGDLFTSGEAKIMKFDLSAPSSPVCEYAVPGGGLTGMAINPQSDEVFYFSVKNKKFHQLSNCDDQGQFTEIPGTVFEAPRPTVLIGGLSFNPALAHDVNRPIGLLYALDAGIPENGQPDPSQGDILAPAEARAPSVESESVSSVGSTAAVLRAKIDPNGFPTRYVFQYLTAEAYLANEPGERFVGAGEAPAGGAVLGTGQVALSAATPVSDLAPDTEYRFRVVASGPEGTVAGGDAAFRTFPAFAAGLPDGRAYELVSPADKSGGEVLPMNPGVSSPCVIYPRCKFGLAYTPFPRQSAPDGEAVGYEGTPFSPGGGAAGENAYVSERTPSGWKTVALSPALSGHGVGFGYEAFDESFSRGLLLQAGPSLSPSAPAGFPNLYLQPMNEPLSLSPLLTVPPPNREPGTSPVSSLQLQFAGGTDALDHVLFTANDSLTTSVPGVAPAAPEVGQGASNLYEWSGGELHLVNVLPGNATAAPGSSFGVDAAISADGSRVFWSSATGQTYVREGASRTRELPDPSKYLTSSSDGGQVLLSDGHLLDLGSEPASEVDLTAGEGGFLGVAGKSADLSSIYFVDEAVLANEPNSEGQVPAVGEPNLYLYRGGHTAFIATLLQGDNLTNPGARPGRDTGVWRESPSLRTAEASPDGSWLAFASEAPLTGYDNQCAACKPDTETGGTMAGALREVFLYDSTTGTLTCPSCNPTNAEPLGESDLPEALEGAVLEQPPYMLNDGRLYFDSRDSLSPFDTNGGIEDVYQYEPPGQGSCARQGGCVSLISAGSEPVDSNFLAVDSSGANVFFTTRDQLVRADRDDLYDLYDAREGGGLSSETEVARTECQGEACQPPAVAPGFPAPVSSLFDGPGNLSTKPTTKPKKKTKHKKHHKAKKHHKKQRKKESGKSIHRNAGKSHRKNGRNHGGAK